MTVAAHPANTSPSQTESSDSTNNALQPILPQMEAEFEVIPEAAEETSAQQLPRWSFSSSSSSSGSDVSSQSGFVSTKHTKLWSSISSAVETSAWEKPLSPENDEDDHLGSALVDLDSQSDRVTAEMVDVEVPATLFGSVMSRSRGVRSEGGWSFEGAAWENTPEPKQRSPMSSIYPSTSSSSLASEAASPAVPFAPNTRRTHYWPFTDRAYRKSYRKRSSAASSTRTSTKPQRQHTQETSPPHRKQKSRTCSCIFFVSLLTALLSVILTYPMSHCASAQPETLLSTILSHPLLQNHIPTSLFHSPPKNQTTLLQPQNETISPTTAPLQTLLQKSQDPLLHLFHSLKSLPTPLNLSLSAHTSLSLATVIDSLESTDSRRVAAGLRELAGALNRAADGIVAVLSEGWYTGRGVVRGLGMLVDGASSLTSNFGEKECQSGLRVWIREWLGVVDRDVDVAKWKKWMDRVDDFVDEVDSLLGGLETCCFDAMERMSMVNVVWQGANGATERERRRVVGAVDEMRGELEELRGESWVVKMLREWLLKDSDGGRGKVSFTERALRGLERDLEVLGEVVKGLKEMAPGIVEISTRVKEIRGGVQRFRSDLKAGRLLKGHIMDDGFEQMKLVVGRLSDAVSVSRN